MCKEYNGYTNYETWLVSLYIDNDPTWSDALKNEPFDQVQENFMENMPNSEGFLTDIIESFFAMVNWREIEESKEVDTE